MTITNTYTKCEESESHPDKRLPSYTYYEHTFSNKVLHFYLTGEIGYPELYTDMVHRIKSASPGDTIFLNLNTSGGNLVTGVQLINAIHSSQAKIVTVLEGECHSLGTLIFLCGDELVVNDNCIMMFHHLSGGFRGKGQEMVAQLDATVKWFISMCRTIYPPFLTTVEIDNILLGQDLWLDSTQIRARLDKMVKQDELEHKKPPIKRKSKKSKNE
jgi:ATP-dependent Clp protease, protease subunit